MGWEDEDVDGEKRVESVALDEVLDSEGVSMPADCAAGGVGSTLSTVSGSVMMWKDEAPYFSTRLQCRVPSGDKKTRVQRMVEGGASARGMELGQHDPEPTNRAKSSSSTSRYTGRGRGRGSPTRGR